MSVKITIGGTDYTQYVDISTVKIDANIAVNSDTAEMNIIIPQQALPRPKGAQEIIIWNGNNKEFVGVVLLPHEEALAPDTMNYDTKCRDYVYWLDKRVVTEQYTNLAAGTIVQNIIQNYTTNFTTNNVQGLDSSFVIPYIKFDHLTVSACMQKLADAVGYDWWIDYNKDVHFGPTNTTASQLPNNQLLADTDTANYGDLYIEEDVSQVRNQIYILGHKIAAQYFITEKQPTDGNQTSFNLNYEPMGDVTQMIIKVGATTYTPKKDLTDGNASNTTADGKAYVHQKNQTVRFNVAPASGVLSVQYKPRYEMVNFYNDPNGMAAMKQRDLQDGVYEFMIRDQQLSGDDTSLADTRGRIELLKYAYPHISGQFYSYLQGWQVGQYFFFTSNNRMDGELQNFQFYVTKVEKTIVNHPIAAAQGYNWASNYVGKVAGSLIANGFIWKYTNGASGLQAPSSFSTEASQTSYNKIQSIDGTSDTTSTTTNGYQPQDLFCFDIIRALTDQFGIGIWGGVTDLPTKVSLAKQYISSITTNAYIYGVTPSGNKAYSKWWNGSSWSTGGSNTASSPTNIAVSSINMNTYIGSDGFLYMLATTDASDGVTTSKIIVDYAEIVITTNQILGFPTFKYTVSISDSPYVF